MKRKYFKTIVGLTLAVLAGILFTTVNNGYAGSTNIVPSKVEISKKEHVNQIKRIASESKDSQVEVNNYLKGLNKKDLLTAIAEVADEIRDNKDVRIQ